MTFIPVVELQEGDLTAFVPTNLVSMTDGQLFLNGSLFNEGFRPAVDIGLSVSRVGSKVQWKATKEISKTLRMEFIQFKELLRASKLQASGASEETRESLRSGKILQALLTQPANKPVPIEIQLMLFYAKNENLFKDLEAPHVQDFIVGFEAFARKEDAALFTLIREKQAMTDEIKKRMRVVLENYVAIIKKKYLTQEADSAVEVA